MENLPPCLLCKQPASVGVLCTGHAVGIASPGVISEQIVSSIATPTASLVDAWGFPHAVASGVVIGREASSGATLSVLHPSISAVHAELVLGTSGWSVVDRGSRNGTSVNGIPITNGPLRAGAALGLGDVRFYFWAPALNDGTRPTGRGRTAPSRTVQRVFAATLATAGGCRIELRARTDGSGFARIADELIPLARMELSLVQVLAERRVGLDAEHAYVAWHEIAARLDFASTEADSENVRALVRRVRKKFEKLAPDGVIESKHGIGYRVAGAITLDAAGPS